MLVEFILEENARCVEESDKMKNYVWCLEGECNSKCGRQCTWIECIILLSVLFIFLFNFSIISFITMSGIEEFLWIKYMNTSTTDLLYALLRTTLTTRKILHSINIAFTYSHLILRNSNLKSPIVSKEADQLPKILKTTKATKPWISRRARYPETTEFNKQYWYPKP